MFCTDRPTPKKGCLCLICHDQMLEALKNRNMTTAECGSGYWDVGVLVSKCWECKMALGGIQDMPCCTPIQDSVQKQMVVRITPFEMTKFFLAGTTAWFVGAPDRAGQSNLSLSTQREVTNADIRSNGLMAQARVEVIPAVISQLSARVTALLAMWWAILCSWVLGTSGVWMTLILCSVGLPGQLCVLYAVIAMTSSLFLRLLIAKLRRGFIRPTRRWVELNSDTESGSTPPPLDGSELTATTSSDPVPTSSTPLPTLTEVVVVPQCLPAELLALPDGITAVQGAHHEAGQSSTEPTGRVVSFTIGPTLEDRVVYENTEGNVDAAIAGRITEAQQRVKFSLNPSQRAELRALSKAMCHGPRSIFSRRKILDMVETLTGQDLKSKKWSAKRFENAIEDLRSRYAPNYVFKCRIKLEPMKGSKPPRLLIADGDAGQVMALLTIGVIERLLFSANHMKSIKEMSKPEAMEQVSKEIHKKPSDKSYAVVESDCTAFDAHTGPQLRDDTENVIIDHVDDAISSLFVPEHHWHERHGDACKASKLKLMFCIQATDQLFDVYATMKKSKTKLISAIRRSGHRGTSVLNWLVNHACWSWVVCGPNASKLADPTTRRVVAHTGAKLSLDSVFEGDDSILGIAGLGEDLFATFTPRWEALGHEAKLFWRRPGGERAEFTGWLFVVDGDGLTSKYAPDAKKHLSNGPLSVSPELKDALEKGKPEAGDLAATTMLSLGVQYSMLPTIGNFFLGQAEALSRRPLKGLMSHELSMKMDLRDKNWCVERWSINQNEWLLRQGIKDSGMESLISKVRAPPPDVVQLEASVAVGIGIVSDEQAWNRLGSYLQTVTPSTDPGIFRETVRGCIL